jgi:signal transduction histidine kinase
MNPAAEEIYGAKLAELAGKTISATSDAKHVVALAAEIEASIAKPLNKDIEVRGSDDTKRLIRSSWAIVKNEGGRVVGMVLALTDLAAHKKVEKMEQEFVAHMTHELRSPLASISAGLELLTRSYKGKIDDQQQTIFTACTVNVKRLASLVNNILDFSKIESGQMTVYPKASDPAKIAGLAVDSLTPWALKKALNLSLSADPALPEVLADPDRTVQVLVNLISNALKFTAKGGRIAVTAGVSPGEADRFVTFAVRDNGCGIPLADRARVFEKFAQVNSAANVGGTGLGLPIAQSMVELQGGRMWLESEEGKGTVFYFTLPVYIPTGAPAPVAEAKPWWRRLFGG